MSSKDEMDDRSRWDIKLRACLAAPIFKSRRRIEKSSFDDWVEVFRVAGLPTVTRAEEEEDEDDSPADSVGGARVRERFIVRRAVGVELSTTA